MHLEKISENEFRDNDALWMSGFWSSNDNNTFSLECRTSVGLKVLGTYENVILHPHAPVLLQHIPQW